LNEKHGAKPPGSIYNILKREGTKRLQMVPWLTSSLPRPTTTINKRTQREKEKKNTSCFDATE
jgi:hypothetical protein